MTVFLLLLYLSGDPNPHPAMVDRETLLVFSSLQSCLKARENDLPKVRERLGEDFEKLVCFEIDADDVAKAIRR